MNTLLSVNALRSLVGSACFILGFVLMVSCGESGGGSDDDDEGGATTDGGTHVSDGAISDGGLGDAAGDVMATDADAAGDGDLGDAAGDVMATDADAACFDLCTTSSSGIACGYWSCNYRDAVRTEENISFAGTCLDYIGTLWEDALDIPEVELALTSCENFGGVVAYDACPCDDLQGTCQFTDELNDYRGESATRYYSNYELFPPEAGIDNLEWAADGCVGEWVPGE